MSVQGISLNNILIIKKMEDLMLNIFLAVLIPALCFGLSFIIDTEENLPKKSGKKRSSKSSEEKIFRRHTLILFAAEVLIFLLLTIFSEYFMFNDGEHINIFAMCITAVLPFLAVSAPHIFKNEAVRKFLKKSAVCVMVIFIAEVAVFNAKSFTDSSVDFTFTAEDITVLNNAEITDGEINITGNAEVEITNVPDGTNALIVDIRQVQDKNSLPFNVSLAMKDGNFSQTYITVQSKSTRAYDEGLDFSFHPYKSIISLKMSLSNISNPVTIKNIRATGALPFAFSMIRFFVLLAVALFVVAIKVFRLYKIKFSFRKRSHIIIAEIMALVCALSTLVFFPPEQEPVEDIESAGSMLVDPYAMTFDAFRKHQVYLDFEAEAGLEDIENVYESTQRVESGLFYLWDYAYYNGRYYCYFGVAPVITFYFPYYWITGKLPTLPMANTFFVFLAVFFFCQALLSTVKLLAPRPNMLLLLGAMPAGMCCLEVFYMLNWGDKYSLPIATGLCYLSLSIWLGTKACSMKKHIHRFVALALGGTFLAFCVASRPGMALGSAILIPFFMGILLNKKEKFSYRITQACCFVVPLLIGGCMIMWYNNARFGSPFDFGAAYQLTVSDIHANHISFAGFFGMLYHYVLPLLNKRASFPFFEPLVFNTNNYGSYAFTDDGIGALAFPLVLVGMLMLPFAVQRKGKRFAYDVTKFQRNAVFAVCCFVPLFIAWQNFCLGGITMRYVIDIMPLFTIISVVTVLRSTVKPSKNKYRYIIAGIAEMSTFCMIWLVAMERSNGNLGRRCPNLYDIAENLIIFWQ